MLKKRKKTSFCIGVVLLLAILLPVLVGFFYMPYDPDAMDVSAKYQAPSLNHLFGTDNFGRDILSRVMVGGRTTFLIALATLMLGGVCGLILGAVTGYFGGILDEALMRANDALTSFPTILLALVFISILGPGKYNIIVALGIIFIPSFARVVRSEYVTFREMDFVKNARLMGASNFRIMFVHILPNTFPILRSTFTIGFNNAVLAESGMSYLGLGVQPPDASLGRMLSEAQSCLYIAPWSALIPGVVIILTVLSITLISER